MALMAAAGLLGLFVVLVFTWQQTLPVPPQQVLQDPWPVVVLFMIPAAGELLLTPAALGLYFAFRSVARSQMLVASALMVLCTPLFLASRGQIFALARLGDEYSAASTDAAQSAYLVAGELAIETQSIYGAMALILLSLASILIGFVLLKASDRTGYVAAAAGVFSLASPFLVMLGVAIVIPFLGLVLMGGWQLVVGARLYRLGGDTSPPSSAHAQNL